MTTINTRSRIQLRWTTDPRIVGDAEGQSARERAESEFRAADPDFVGTPRQVMDEIARVRRVTGGAYIRIECSHNGEILPPNAVGDVVNESEYRRSHGNR